VRREERELRPITRHISPVHLYIHVPFCARRCSYCDFAIAVRRDTPTEAYVSAILKEWSGWQEHRAWATSPTVETVYFGGGTPSRIDPGAIDRLLSRIASDRALESDAEITLEANPEDVTPERAAAWRAAGVTRISLGAQTFDPTVLRWMHRTHSADEIALAVDAVRSAGIPELSLDLIFGLPAALARAWDADVEQALALEPEHLSLYGLTIEPHTVLGRWTERGDLTPVSEERYAEEFLAAHARLIDSGFEHYEVSNAARLGHRARHNSAYWLRAPYIGLGPSAHSGFGDQRQWNVREWGSYEQAVCEGLSPVAGHEQLTPEQVALENLYLGLRTQDGIPPDLVSPATRKRWIAAGWAKATCDRLVLTPEGWLRLDALVASVSG
jgi:oxygen-independent coproporphyrinogen-3 oxidase